MITEHYREQNAQLHATRKDYGARGGQWAPVVMQLCAEFRTADVLDYGCGKATLNCQLPFGCDNYDPAIPKYAEEPESADVVVCTDVLEHIEPEHIDDVLAHIKDLTRKVALLNIATRPAVKTLPDGRNAHLIVEDALWWKDKLLEAGFSIEKENTTSNDMTVIVKHA